MNSFVETPTPGLIRAYALHAIEPGLPSRNASRAQRADASVSTASTLLIVKPGGASNRTASHKASSAHSQGTCPLDCRAAAPAQLEGQPLCASLRLASATTASS